MFATLLGPLPRPPLPESAAPEAVLEAVLAVQLEHDLEPLIGWIATGGDTVAAWRSTAAMTDRLVKGVVTGPITADRPVTDVRAELLALADAGCAWIEVHEPAATAIGSSEAARARFADTHRALTDGLDGVHLSLVITGGSADEAGAATVLAGAYASLALDLIRGPDAWRLAAATPGERGLVCGVVSPIEGSDDGPELMLWAAGYAASMKGRGAGRVGLATAGSFADLPWDVAARKVERLGHAFRLASAGPDERAAAVDPRAASTRSAAMGRIERHRPAPPTIEG